MGAGEQGPLLLCKNFFGIAGIVTASRLGPLLLGAASGPLDLPRYARLFARVVDDVICLPFAQCALART
ncbi:hypothetical protein, partial [Xanthomonas vesicatoria]|uniref:hypothetical protein n=1 Tax=Xanthomonas vesicatoria TaxID=56460 RepID=UPI001C1298D4